MTSQNENKQYSESVSCSGNSISELQKNEIRKAVLCAISSGHYHPSLAEEACKAISYINNYSDGRCVEELVDNKSGEVFRKI